MFNRELFEKYSILTSRSIQERYVRSKTSVAKKQIDIEDLIRPELNLLNKELELNIGDLRRTSANFAAK